MTDNPRRPYTMDNNGKPIASPFQDVRMRKAVSLAINRQAISDRIMDGLSYRLVNFLKRIYRLFT